MAYVAVGDVLRGDRVDPRSTTEIFALSPDVRPSAPFVSEAIRPAKTLVVTTPIYPGVAMTKPVAMPTASPPSVVPATATAPFMTASTGRPSDVAPPGVRPRFVTAMASTAPMPKPSMAVYLFVAVGLAAVLWYRSGKEK